MLRTGVCVIGRNEGSRLTACLSSLGEFAARSVYVDSGSTDGSQANALALGVAVIELDSLIAFTAARARNAGYAALLKRHADLDYVQFIDGDCTLSSGWMAAAVGLLEARPEVALVCGRRRERFPERSPFNAMCDKEWNGPVGPIAECGGDFLVRTTSFSQVDGFRDSLIAGEEPELCLRLREKGWQIWRLDEEMTLHDANITRLGQWWRRTVRAGHAFAEVSWLHRNSPLRIWHRNVVRALGWSAVVALSLIGMAITPWSLLLLMVYPANIVRQAARGGLFTTASWRDAFFSNLGKFAEAQGIAKFHSSRLFGRRSALIEYK